MGGRVEGSFIKVKMKVGCQVWVFVSAYGPDKEIRGEERRVLGRSE